MKEREALEMARNFARDKGYDPAQYDAKVEQTNTGWEFFFRCKPENYKPHPGDFFTIGINTASRTVEKFFPGK